MMFDYCIEKNKKCLDLQKNTYRRSINAIFYESFLFCNILCSICCIFSKFLFSTTLIPDFIISILVILVSFYTCYLYRYNIGMFIVQLLIFYSNYSITVAVYLDKSIRNDILYEQFLPESLSVALYCIYIFEVCILLLSRKIAFSPKSIDSSSGSFINCETNDLIACGSIILYLLIFFATFDFGENGARGQGSAINEYRLVVAIIGCFYSGGKNRKLYKFVWTLLILSTSLIVFFNGSRVDAIASLILLVVFWWYDIVSYKRILVVLPVFVIFMVAIGSVRGGDITRNSFLEAFRTLSLDKLTWDTPHFAHAVSVSIAELSSYSSVLLKFNQLIGHFLYFFLGSSFTDSLLITYSSNYYIHYNGCVSPVYFYYWFGFIGPILFALLNFKYIKFYLMQRCVYYNFFSRLKYLLSMYYVCNVSRWYLYGPLYLIRGAFVFTIIFFIVYLIDVLLRRKKLL